MTNELINRFSRVLERIAPHDSEVDALKAHKNTIEAALAREFEHYNRVEVIGSHTRDTAIRSYSDVDYLAVLGKNDVIRGGYWVNSSTTLNRLKGAMEQRFKTTRVRIDGPAVVIDFAGGAGSVDVVPGVWKRIVSEGNGYPVFAIPDGEDGWMETSPQWHARYLNMYRSKAGRFPGTIRLLKHWKYSRQARIPVLGFHLEMLVSSGDICGGVATYRQTLVECFRVLTQRNGRDLQNPLQMVGKIPCARTQRQREEVAACAAYAWEHARAAVAAESRNDLAEAVRQWKIVFGDGSF